MITNPFLTGVRGAFSTPSFVLVAAVFGFGGLAEAAGFTRLETVVMTGMIWALPGQVVLVGAVAAGSGLVAASLAVSLSAVRLLPMTVSLLPILRSPRTSKLTLLILSHFVAVTAWVEGMTRLPAMPREARIPYFAGFCIMLVSLAMLAAGIGHSAAGVLPPLLSAGLLILTPTYFVITLTRAATSLAEKIAMPLGLVIGPAAALTLPGPDLLWAGFLGGTLAYAIDRWSRRR